MWWVVSVLFLVQIASPKPTADDAETARQPRHLDFGECCPCPDNTESFTSQGRWLLQNGRNLEHPGNERSFNNNGFSRSGIDDCPCRPREADSEGSSSIFFPSALRPSGPLSKSPDSKEDPKNLLEPEVGLASSVLETLRAATDEEYRDALARDAARSRAAEDATPEESAQNIVTIILPDASDEDIVSEPSHVQESRCIHPLGSTLSRLRAPVAISPLPDIFKLATSMNV
ncbi:hypothetical protein O3G_MSEX014568 [Manduca sexta]|uniref:Uncharacterized protein n=1 Tax=Manduca sexta TaxID=7130 RepID=A0A921ZU16_MANSE|nr:hypothetical protein O3G_MSEX014568 [Manduca sexta]